jgi:hypothetical protein
MSLQKAFKDLLSDDEGDSLFLKAKEENPWFSESEVKLSLQAWINALQPEKIQKWVPAVQPKNSKTIGLILAGNIPLVGLHDVLSVIVSGHKLRIKLSSNDSILMNFAIDTLIRESHNLKSRIELSSDMKGIDAIIATGSSNTSRYFDYYFAHLPKIIRRNRHSIAVLTGKETEEDLNKLCEDIFSFFGLGCRSVSKLLVPKEYDFTRLFEASERFRTRIASNIRFANNLDYNLALFMVNKEKFLTNNLFILQKNNALGSPIGVVHYEEYGDSKEITSHLINLENEIQCVVGHGFDVPFGKSQYPELTDYADGINTLKFLAKL